MKSGRFVLRITPALHTALERRAEARHQSLNQVCKEILASAVEGPAAGTRDSRTEAWLRLAQRVSRQAGMRLEAVVLFGSVVRGVARPDSDIDLLWVVSNEVPLSRSLYGRVDGEAAQVEPSLSIQLAHAPDPRGEVGSLWLEVALEGRILWEADGGELSGKLAELRRQIAAGRYVRSVSHGQGVWKAGTGA